MKRMLSGLMICATLLVVSSAALAQDAEGQKARRGDRGGRREGAGRRAEGERSGEGRGEGRGGRQRGQQLQRPQLKDVLEELGLGDVQRERIREILAEAGESVDREAMAAKAKAAREAMEAARESGDRDAMRAAREAMSETARDRRAAGSDVQAKIAAVLTIKQRAKFEHLMGPAGPFEKFRKAVGALELTDAQRREIREIVAEANADAKVAEEDAKGPVYRAASQAVMDILTDEQKAQLRRSTANADRRRQGRNRMDELDLSSDQQEAMDTIREETRAAMEAAETRQARRELMREARERMSEVLTDEQREQFRQQRRNRRGDGEGRGDGGERRRRGETGDDAEH